MSVSAWGVDHGTDEISKAFPGSATFGRLKNFRAPRVGGPATGKQVGRGGSNRKRNIGIAAGAAGAAAAGAGGYEYNRRRGVEKSWKDGKDASGKGASGGRVASGALFPGIHSLVAGKGAKGKAKAFGTEVGSSYAGATLAGAASRGRLRTLGAVGGAAAGTGVSHGAGWLKRQDRS